MFPWWRWNFKRAASIKSAYNWPSDKDEALAEPIELKWADIDKCVKEQLPRGQKTRFKAETWKPRFQTALTGAVGLSFKGYAAKG